MHSGFLGDWPNVEITAETFEAAQSARDVLRTIHGFEERYQLSLENYREYEQSLLGIALEQLTSWRVDWVKTSRDL